MRTNVITAVANRTVFGFGQDRVVSLRDASCARAAQHLRQGKRRGWAMTFKRRWPAVAHAVAVLEAGLTRLAITGPLRMTVRPMSPVVAG